MWKILTGILWRIADVILAVPLFLCYIVCFILGGVFGLLAAGKHKTQQFERQLRGKLVVMTVDEPGPLTEVTRELLDRGARVIMGCPDVALMKTYFEPDDNIDVRKFNVFNLASVKNFASRILKEEQKIYMLINGCERFERDSDPKASKTTVDRFDRMHQSVYLAPFLLTDALLPLIRGVVRSRIITTVAANFYAGDYDGNPETSFKYDETKTATARYADAHYEAVVWTRLLGAELRMSETTVNAVYPGSIYPLYKWFSTVIYESGPLVTKSLELLFGRSVMGGYHALLNLCLDPCKLYGTGNVWFGDLKISDAFMDDFKHVDLVENTRRALKNWSVVPNKP